MEEKNKKKQKSRGKKMLPVLLFAFILVAGFGGAVLVDYLSNQAEANVEIESPLDLKLSIGDGWKETIDMSAYGGDTISFNMKEENRGNSEIDSTLEIVIDEDGVDNKCSEITSLEFKNKEASNFNSVEGTCDNTGTDLVYSVDSVAPAGETNEYNVKVTFAQNAKGNYTSSIQHKI